MTPWMKARRILGLEGPKIVTVGLIAGNKILTGQRRDNNKWTNPGGHMDQGESLIEAACREALEESGIKLDPTELELISAERITSEKTGKPFSVFAFLARIPQKRATNKHDPDEEISQWKWVELSPESPELHPENRHAQHDHVLCYLGHCRSHGRLSSKKQTDFTGRRLQMQSDEYTEVISDVSREIQQGQESEGQAIYNLKPNPKRSLSRLSKQKVGDIISTDKSAMKVKRVIKHKDYEIYECEIWMDGQPKPERYPVYLNSKNGYIHKDLNEAKSY